jgi:YD repeat-containing protein
MENYTQEQEQTYTYDELDRLTSVIYKNGQKVTYTYDAAGNPTSVTVTPGVQTGNCRCHHRQERRLSLKKGLQLIFLPSARTAAIRMREKRGFVLIAEPRW